MLRAAGNGDEVTSISKPTGYLITGDAVGTAPSELIESE